jgi:hypothetical protein
MRSFLGRQTAHLSGANSFRQLLSQVKLKAIWLPNCTWENMRKLVMMVMTVMAIALSVGAASLTDTSSFSSANEPESILLFGTALLIVGGILRRRVASRSY